ncbi:diguanylate cyclase domain-containing protein [Rhodoferax sp.]|uniref:diguanylate cyclase domain-containing protein n=1 Tax=Rhodoferax sp. TaxID=50421 RepID=UPI00284AE454|nr:diguanylate cyclase [Rhodoferax sp.]MDR3367844.1 diguanylate cyclase [Rhodoferax sp.]
MSLQRLNDFVRQLAISSHGVAFIIESDGRLIASSSSPNTVRLPDGSSARVNAVDSDSPLQRAAYLQVRDRVTSDHQVDGPTTHLFTGPDGDAAELAYDHVLDAAGLNWIVVVAVPRSDFMQGITANIQRTMLIGLLAAIAAVTLGLSILGWVSRDIKRLTQAVQDVGEGRLDAPLDVNRNDEIGVLANTFRKMQYQLRTDVLTGLNNQDMMMRSITNRIEHGRRQQDSRSFAVLFVDLNNFKMINDGLGHEAGDRALVEIAARLSAAIRPGDLVARYAGDEFVLLINDVSSRQAAEQVRRNLETVLLEPLQQVDFGERSERAAFGGAVGLAMYPADGERPEDLIKLADKDMYERKRMSRFSS